MAALAARQHRVVARWQLKDIGFANSRVDRLVRAGMLHRKFRGVYAVGTAQLAQKGLWMSAVLAAGRPAVLSRGSAACRWSLFEVHRGPVAVTAPGRADRLPGIDRSAARLADDEVVLRDNIPITTPLRTLFDVAGELGEAKVERVMAAGIEMGLFRAVDVEAGLERYSGRRGTAVVRRVHGSGLAEAGRTRSELEEAFLRFLDKGRLPRPQLNVRMDVAGREIEADCVWAAERVIAELDGWSTHSGRSSFFGDRRRDRGLVADGWRTIRITDRDLRRDPAGLAADLRVILGGDRGRSAA